MRSDGVKRCANPTDCKSMNYNHLIGTSPKECKDECEDYYKSDVTISGVSFIQCFLTVGECYSYYNSVIYYLPNLKEARKAKGLTQKEVCEKLQMKQSQ